MLSGDTHTFRASFTKSSSDRWFSSVVSLLRTSTVLFHLDVPMTVHSAGDLRSFRASPMAIFSMLRRYLWLTGRSVESTLSPCRLLRSMLRWVSHREGWSME